MNTMKTLTAVALAAAALTATVGPSSALGRIFPGHGPVVKKADLQKWVATLAAIRTKVKTACAGGVADAASRIDLKDLGIPTLGMLERGLPGMCRELAQ